MTLSTESARFEHASAALVNDGINAHLPAGASQMSERASAKLSAESHESFLSGLAHGFENRAKEALAHPLTTGLEVAGSFAVGVGISLATRNPDALAGWAGRIGAVAPKVFLGMTGVDLGRRVLSAHNSGQLGENLGAALFDYPVMFAAGGAGARAFAGDEFMSAPKTTDSNSAQHLHASDNATTPVRPAENVQQQTSTSAPNVRQSLRTNGDTVTKFEDGNSMIIESPNGAKTYKFSNGDWLWTHPDGTTVEGKLKAPDPEEEVAMPPEHQISTTTADGTTHDGFPESRLYIQHSPLDYTPDQADRLISRTGNTSVYQSMHGDTITRAEDGTITTDYAGGGQSVQYANGSDIYNAPDQSHFVRFADNNWYWQHPDGTVVRGTPRQFSSAAEYFAATEGLPKATLADYNVETTLPDGTTHDGYPQTEGHIKQPFVRATGDLLRITDFPDGSSMREEPTGGIERVDANGVAVNETPDGVKTTTFPDHTLLVEHDGEQSFSFPDGDSLHKLPDGSYEELHGHKAIFTAADGSVTTKTVARQRFATWQSTETPEGQITAQNKFGDHTTVYEDRKVTEFANGGIGTRYNNGTEIYEGKDGTTFYRFASGDWLWTHPDQTAVEGKMQIPVENRLGYDAPPSADYTVRTTKPDGTVIDGFPEEPGYIKQAYSRIKLPGQYLLTKFPDGQSIREYESGIRKTVEADGTRIKERPSGATVITFKNGASITEDPHNGTVADFGDGTAFSFRPNGDIVENSNAGTIQLNNDGSSSKYLSNGLRIADNGEQKVYSDTHGFRVVEDAEGNLRAW